MYITAEEAEREEAVKFVEFLLLDGAEIISDVGYIPFPEHIYPILFDRFMSGRTGTVFIEGTATSGVRLDDLLFAGERE